jgi:DNA polymerase-3 subunit alpha (Gram-positive type)
MLAEFADWPAEEAYKVVVTNPNRIADQIEAFSPLLDKLYPPIIPGAEEN